MEERKQLLATYDFGRMTVFYLHDMENDVVGMSMLPTELKQLFSLEGRWGIESLVQLKFIGDAYPGWYSQGQTMHNSDSSYFLKLVEHKSIEREKILPNGNSVKITDVVTTLRSNRITVYHTLTYREGTDYVKINTKLENTSGSEQKLELISSFSVCDLSAALSEERMADMKLYRLTSKWSGEGKVKEDSFLDLHMEPSWARHGAFSCKYGQVGSMPVRGYFPYAAVEDTRFGYFIGAQLYYPGSWQMELYSKEDKASLSGGLADRDFGHFIKKLNPGECFETPQAVVAACMGGLDDISYCLTSAQNEALEGRGGTEEELPVLFNEYCTTWGEPTIDNLKKITDHIKGHGFKYLVMDSGWYMILDNSDWWSDQGDWNINKKRFPNGLKELTDYIRAAGMIPGIWFEYECLGGNAKSYTEMEEFQLKRDGVIISDAGKRFFDMKKPEVTEYLDEKVIGLLNREGFGYIKVDYNGNYGIGPDGEESFGEELRKTVLASAKYFERMREKVPGLVIENCASGGHRLEPLMMGVSDMASFSDAHECDIIPIIAANVHRAILPRQSQIWAVIRATDDEKRLYYSMINGLLGRLCLSGDIYDISKRAWEIIDDGIAFYGECSGVIKKGISYIELSENMDYAHPRGHQIVVRRGMDESHDRIMVVAHRFSGEQGDLEIDINHTYTSENIISKYAEDKVHFELNDGKLKISGLDEMSAAAVLISLE